MKLADAYLEEKVLSTVGISLTYKSIQENLIYKPQPKENHTKIQWLDNFLEISFRWYTWRLGIEAVEAPFDIAAAVVEF